MTRAVSVKQSQEDDLDISEMTQRAYTNSFKHGFWDYSDASLTDKAFIKMLISQKLALIHSEVSEALEELRDADEFGFSGRVATEGKPIGFGSELADIAIRLGDLSEAIRVMFDSSFDLDAEIERKMSYNETRPHKHGKSF